MQDRNIWIQKADTSIIDVKAESADDVIKAFRAFNWNDERRKRRTMGNEGVDPGLGFGMYGDERFMHILPKDEDTVEVLYVVTHPATKKLLGFIPMKSERSASFMGEHLSKEQTEEIIRAYWMNDGPSILIFCDDA